MKKEGFEFKVGIFVVLALAILIGMVIKAGDFYFRPGYTVRLIFDSVSGIDRGSEIRLAGVPVGEVKHVQIERDASGNTQVVITAFITKGVILEEDAWLRVVSTGFLGDKYIEVMPGSKNAKSVADGGTLVGKKYSGVDDLFDSGHRLIDKMQFTMDNINEVVSDAQFKASLKGTFSNTDKVSKNLIETSEDLKETIKSARIVMERLKNGEGTVGKLLMDDKIAKDLEAFVADLKKNPWKLLKKG